jgi:hypothetical protein
MSDISGISSTSPTWPTQSTSSVHHPTNRDGDGDNDSSRASGVSGTRHREHGGGAFLQDVMQSLQSLGLNLSGNNSSSPDPASGSTQGTSAVPSNVRQALHTFLHDLHQALRQSGGAQQQGTVDSHGDNDKHSSSSSSAHHGYSNLSTNLQNLIGSLFGATASPPPVTATAPAVATDPVTVTIPAATPDPVTATTPAATPDPVTATVPVVTTANTAPTGTIDSTTPTGTTNSPASKLQTDFTNLVNSITGTSNTTPANKLQADFSNLLKAIAGEPPASAPTLQDFLNKMLSNANDMNTAHNGVGSIFSEYG